MKRNIILATVAVAAGVAYFIRRRMNSSKMNGNSHSAAKPSHHLTNVFAKAKEMQ
jgi:hypothetical protein